MRRLPVYLLLDTSGSMYGEPIEAVKNGVQTLISTLRSDPYALETAYISVLTFNTTGSASYTIDRVGAVSAAQLRSKRLHCSWWSTFSFSSKSRPGGHEDNSRG